MNEEIIKLSEETRKNKTTEQEVFCEDCPLFSCEESEECKNKAYTQGFLDGYKAAFDVLINKIKDIKP